jgi:hypothetical protein
MDLAQEYWAFWRLSGAVWLALGNHSLSSMRAGRQWESKSRLVPIRLGRLLPSHTTILVVELDSHAVGVHQRVGLPLERLSMTLNIAPKKRVSSFFDLLW